MSGDPTASNEGSTSAPPSSSEQKSEELSSRRTGMSFQRTRMSAERTLMSAIRTSLALIGFGFTIYQFFSHLREVHLLSQSSRAPRHFGAALVALGVVMLTLGIVYHALYMAELRRQRERMVREGLIHGESRYPASMTLITASLLLMLGLLVAISVTLGVGPLH